MSWPVVLEGFGLGAGLIIAIGAQNAFVLRQGLLRRHVFLIASICTLSDAALISLGVAGLGAVIERAPMALTVTTWGGAAFLFYYGLRAFRKALQPQTLEAGNSPDNSTASLRATVLAVLAFSLLNPHVYLDTVIVLGGIGARHAQTERLSFILGASGASLMWFFGLAYGAALLAPAFRNPVTWRILEAAIGCVMWLIAARLVFQ
jgi:L-lysine exporter family protein LysE/ArgO